MNNHLQKIQSLSMRIMTLTKQTGKELFLMYKDFSRVKQALIALIFLIVIVGVVYLLSIGDSDIQQNKEATRTVKVESISSLLATKSDFPLVGEVTSVSEATIRSETGGKLTRVYKKLGDTIDAGGIIAEFENSGERASVLQAEGAYEQAKSSRDIARLNSGQAGSSLIDTKSQALNALSNAYSSMDDAVRGKTDSAFTSPTFDEVKFILSIPDANLSTSLESKRRLIEKALRARESEIKSLTQTSDLVSELQEAQQEAQMIKLYLDDLYTAYSKALPDATYTQTVIDIGKSNTQGARQSVIATISAVVSARSSLTASVTANQVAGAGSQSSGTLASADAQVKQALGAYNAALSRLEKTIIRSPIRGTLNSLSITTGDYIGSFTQVAIVSNNGALEVLSFVTEDDAKRITVGSAATINGKVKGVVTRIASAIDPTTKKIEIRIGIQDARSALTNGQSVQIVIAKNTIKELTDKNSGPIVIPLSALKLTPRGANVFTVSASSTLVALPVKEGAILGEQIQILSGLTGEETIVVDARGLKEGLVVEIVE
jgi:multidrug efflux pump subunit AcrA (membrane-fusion protein)